LYAGIVVHFLRNIVDVPAWNAWDHLHATNGRALCLPLKESSQGGYKGTSFGEKKPTCERAL